ncbi:MAG TPA: hypothetical protein VFC44_15240 [Candidatus Saccharimonadales bacterium]|nr:hypothetical protein [Candidatus Saccharimonadales bacterium]
MQWNPNAWPKTFSEGCLYGIFGRLIVSARTESTRLEYALEMLAWWHDQINADSAATIRANTPARMTSQDWTPEQIIDEKKRDGFSAEDYDGWNFVTQRWMGKRFKRRGVYKPKNQLDGFLRHVIGGKYKHRRYDILRDYLINSYKQTPEEAEMIIASSLSSLSDHPS